MKRWLMVCSLGMLALSSCERVEESKEIGHTGMAQINPYLAAERFLRALDYEVRDELRWPDLSAQDAPAMMVLPLSLLTPQGYVNQLHAWVRNGGHAVILVSHAESYGNDWIPQKETLEIDPKKPSAGERWLKQLGMEVGLAKRGNIQEVTFDDEKYEVWMDTENRVDGAFFRSQKVGDNGRLTVLADAKPFRNRWIGDHEHAALLADLTWITPYEGPIVFLRHASLSFWKLLWARAWPVLLSLGVLILFWLWKNMPRFGPLDDHLADRGLRETSDHLEVLGNFHWRLDRAESLLKPLREALVERAQQLALATHRQNEDLFELMGERAGLPGDRTRSAILDTTPKDMASFTRLSADLQKIQQSLS